MAFQLLAGSAILATVYIMYRGFKQTPGQIDADPDLFDPSDYGRVTEEHPVDSVSSAGLSGIGAQAATKPQQRKYGQSQDPAYQTPVPSGNFAPKGSPYAEDSKKTIAQSQEWLSRNPATIAINKFNRTQDSHVVSRSTAREVAEGRASQYIGAAATKNIASIPIGKRGHIYHSPASHAALASAKKSHVLNTLSAHTVPPGSYSKKGTGAAHTAIKTGRLSKTTY